MLGVHHTTVSTARHELVVTGEISQLKKTFGNAKLAEFLSRSIPLAIELAKQPIGQWVHNSLWLGGRFQVLLGNISCRGCFIHQHMIPGLVLWRPRARDLLVPFFRSVKYRVNIEYNPDVVKQLVVNYLSDLEFCFMFRHSDHQSRLNHRFILIHFTGPWGNSLQE